MKAVKTLLGIKSHKLKLAQEIFARAHDLQKEDQLDKALDDYLFSLRLRKEKDPESILTTNCLDQIGIIHYLKGNLDESLSYLNQSYEIKRKKKFSPLEIAHSLTYLADLCRIKRDFETALGYGTSALLIYEKRDPKSFALARLLNILAQIDIKTNNLDTALRKLEEAKEILGTQEKYADHLADSLYHISKIFYTKSQFDNSLSFGVLAIDIYQKTIPQSNKTGNCHDHLGDIFKAQSRYELALSHYENALNIYRGKLKTKSPFTLYKIGQIHKTQNNHQEALTNLKSALRFFLVANHEKHQGIITKIKTDITKLEKHQDQTTIHTQNSSHPLIRILSIPELTKKIFDNQNLTPKELKNLRELNKHLRLTSKDLSHITATPIHLSLNNWKQRTFKDNKDLITRLLRNNVSNIWIGNGAEYIFEQIFADERLETLNHIISISLAGYSIIDRSHFIINQTRSSPINFLFNKCPNISTLTIKASIYLGSLDFSGAKTLSNLTDLQITESDISDSSLNSILHLTTNLEKLKLGIFSPEKHLGFFPLTLSKIPRLPNLKTLNLARTKVNKASVKRIFENCPNLEHLILRLNRLDSEFNFEEVSTTNNLKIIDFSNSKYCAKSMIQSFTKFPNLTTFQASGTMNHFELDNMINNHQNFKHLKIGGNSIPGSSLIQLIRKCPNIQTISVPYCQSLRKINPDQIPPINHLTDLNLESSNINPQAIIALIEKSPILQSINLQGIWRLESIKLNHQKLPNTLKSLHLSRSKITGQFLEAMLIASPDIEEIDISYCDKLSDFKTNNLIELPNLKSINLSKTINFSSSHILFFLKNCPKLQTINLSENPAAKYLDLEDIQTIPNLTDINCTSSNIPPKTILQLLNKSPNLENLSIYNCSSIEDLDLSQIQKPLALKTLNASKTNFTKEDLIHLLQRSPRLQYVELKSCYYIKDDLNDKSVPELKSIFGVNRFEFKGVTRLVDSDSNKNLATNII